MLAVILQDSEQAREEGKVEIKGVEGERKNSQSVVCMLIHSKCSVSKDL